MTTRGFRFQVLPLLCLLAWCPTAVIAQSVDTFTLIDASTDLPVPGYDPLVEGAVIDTSVTGASLTIRANTTPGTDFGSVVFALSGATIRDITENVPVWALYGDVSGDYQPGNFSNGAHTLRATPYPANNGVGTAGAFLEINFTVTDGTSGNPVADAGPDRSLILPENQATLDGSGSNDDGSIQSFLWSQISGPTTAALTGETTAMASVSGLIAGIYVFQLTVTDNDLNSDIDEVSVYVVQPGSSAATITGELRRWHDISFSWSGPMTSETATTNPFSDFRLDVIFTHSASGKSLVIPGYYAADGDAAETSAEAGNIWRAHFSPSETGLWTWIASFRTGPDVAVDANAAAGSSAGFFDGDAGTFMVLESDKTGRDLRGKGLLEYVGSHHLRFAGNGEWFMKAGADAPENLLAYEDFDDTPNDPKGNANLRKSWSPHAADYDPASSAFTWQSGKGTELLGSVRYLASEELNAFSFLTFNVDGDDDNVFPHRLVTSVADYESAADNTRWAGNKIHHDRFDVSKMAQWERIFSYADVQGMYLHFKTQETENDQKMDGGALGRERILYYRELVARFSHHLALNWNLGEENTNSDLQRKAFAQWFEDNDPYQHPIVLHTYPGEKNLVYTPMLGSASQLDGLSLQGSSASFADTFSDTLTWVANSANAGRKWVVAYDEPGDAQHALRPDNDAGSSQIDGRKDALWGNAMAGGAGCEFYFGYGHAESDLTLQDFRSRDQFWDVCRYFLQFWQGGGAPFHEMTNRNDLISGAGNNLNRCLARPGIDYVIQLRSGGTATLDLPDIGGSFEVRWFDPRNGGGFQQGSVTSISGGANDISLGTAPDSPTEDWIGHVSRPASNKRLLFVRGAERSGGFLEAGDDTERTEQLADIGNLGVSSGNHGWGSFRIALENAGYTVDQLEETAENSSGASAGIAPDLAGFDFSQWNLLLFGSNNATYSAASIDAFEKWIREDGGSAIFISDANFGGSWSDAPDSDQPFLTRFGLTVNQDQGTYVLRRSEGDFPNPGHPILDGIDAFDGEGVSPFVLGSLPVPAGTTLTRLAVAEGNTRNNNGNPGSSRPVTANDASLVAIEAGYGRVVGHFDRNTFFNLNGAGTNLARFDNTALGLNLIGWLTREIDPITPYEGFAQTHFALLPGGRNDPQAAFDFDFDSDGIANGIEYVLGTDPTTFTEGIEHAPGIENGAFTLLIADPVPADAALVIQASGTLQAGHWEDLATRPAGGVWSGPVSAVPEGAFTRITLGEPAQPRRFYRLSVTLP